MKIWQLHTVNLIGLIFGYSAATIVFHVPIKFQLPTSLTFSVIGDRANSTFERPKKSHFRVFLSKIRISLKICTPLRLVVRLTNFENFREKAKIWPKIWAKSRFSANFCSKFPFILKGVILCPMPDDTVFDGQLPCMDTYTRTMMVRSYRIAKKYGFSIFPHATWKLGNSTPLTRFLGILQPQSSFAYRP